MYKVLALGESGVGKTNLLTQYAQHRFNPHTTSTIAVDFLTCDVPLDECGSPLVNKSTSNYAASFDDETPETGKDESPSSSSSSSSVKVQLWDTAGQERFNAFVSTIYRGAHGALIVFDLSSSDSFEEVTKWVERIRSETGNMNIPLVLVGNKSDLVHLRAVSQQEAQQLAAKLQLPYIESSALHRTNVEKAFGMLVSSIHHRRSDGPSLLLSSTANDESTQQSNSSASFSLSRKGSQNINNSKHKRTASISLTAPGETTEKETETADDSSVRKRNPCASC